MRTALFIVAGLAGCALLRVPEHTHVMAELGRSCAETCAPGRCDSSYDVAAQKEIACEEDAERFALCVCRAP